MLITRLITDERQLMALRGAWTELLLRSDCNEPTLSPAWMLTWWSLFGNDGWRSLRTLAFFEDERLVGLVPLLARPYLYSKCIPFRRLELLASGEHDADAIHSDYIGPVAERGRERAVVEAFVDALVSGVAGDWDELNLPMMKGNGALSRRLDPALRARGLEVSTTTTSRAPYAPLPDSWEKYLAALPGQHRAHIRKSLRAFELWAGAPPSLTFARDPSTLAQAQRILVDLHSLRWPDGGVFASPKFRSFHELVQRDLLDEGALDLGWLSVRDEPVAAFYNITWNHKSYFYQSGRVLEVPKDVRVGVVMHACLIRSAIERGLREYDFLAGESRYKATFASATRAVITVRAARPSAVETARRASFLTLSIGRALRDRFRKDPPAG